MTRIRTEWFPLSCGWTLHSCRLCFCWRYVAMHSGQRSAGLNMCKYSWLRCARLSTTGTFIAWQLKRMGFRAHAASFYYSPFHTGHSWGFPWCTEGFSFTPLALSLKCSAVWLLGFFVSGYCSVLILQYCALHKLDWTFYLTVTCNIWNMYRRLKRWVFAGACHKSVWAVCEVGPLKPALASVSLCASNFIVCLCWQWLSLKVF